MSLSGELAPLQDILNQILGRIEVIESKIQIGNNTSNTGALSSTTNDDIADTKAVAAYDKHISTVLQTFIATIQSIPGLAESSLANDLKTAWAAIRTIVQVASQCKKPSSLTLLAPYLKPAQDSLSNIRKLRLSRDFDYHLKAILEMTSCLGWVMIDSSSDPPSPSLFIKTCIGSSDFWANKIRKANKGKDTAADPVAKNNILFCDTLKAMIQDLVAYAKEYHMSGLAWNFNGRKLEDYKVTDVSSSGSTNATAATSTSDVSKKTTPAVPKLSIADELAEKRSSAGNSAATGLKKVTKDQQTWRKEFKGDAAVLGNTSRTKNASAPKTTTITAKKTSPPVFEFQNRGSKWVIEHHNTTTTPEGSGALVVTIADSKQNVYLYKCEGVTVDIKGKFNSVVVDACVKCNVVFDSVISTCELVNCKKIQVQTRGICPSFSIDKTDGLMVYLSKETMGVSGFVTSKSSEMNVSFPDENTDEMKEQPIPEQFSHKLSSKGILVSEVSDLYH